MIGNLSFKVQVQIIIKKFKIVKMEQKEETVSITMLQNRPTRTYKHAWFAFQRTNKEAKMEQ